jgi:hypothetical protein
MGVGHVRLETGDSFPGQGFHRREDVTVNVLKDPVKAAIDNSLPPRKAVVLLYLAIKAAPGGAEAGVIDDARRPAAGGGNRPRVRIGAGNGKTGVEAQVGVDVNPAGNNDFPRGVNDLDASGGGVGGGGKVAPDAGNFFTLAENVADGLGFFSNNKPVSYQYVFHFYSRPAGSFLQN